MHLQQRRPAANALSLTQAYTLPRNEMEPMIKYQAMSCRKAYSMSDSMVRDGDGDGLGQEQQEEQFQLAMTDLVDLTRPTPHLEMMPRLSINNWRAAVAAVAITVVVYSHIVAKHN